MTLEIEPSETLAETRSTCWLRRLDVRDRRLEGHSVRVWMRGANREVSEGVQRQLLFPVNDN